MFFLYWNSRCYLILGGRNTFAVTSWPKSGRAIRRAWRRPRYRLRAWIVGVFVALLVVLIAIETISPPTGPQLAVVVVILRILEATAALFLLVVAGATVILIAGIPVMLGLGPGDVALSRWLWREHAIIEWLVPRSSGVTEADTQELGRVITAMARRSRVSVATTSGRVAARCRTEEDWEAVVTRWSSGAQDGVRWVVQTLPEEDAGHVKYLLRLGAKRVGPGMSLKARRKDFAEAVGQAVGLVGCVFMIALILGFQIARPAEIRALRRAPKSQTAHNARWTDTDVVYWTLTTVTTTGYGDITPVTTTGRLVAMTDMVLGYLALGLLIGYISAHVFAYQRFKEDYFEAILNPPELARRRNE